MRAVIFGLFCLNVVAFAMESQARHEVQEARIQRKAHAAKSTKAKRMFMRTEKKRAVPGDNSPVSGGGLPDCPVLGQQATEKCECGYTSDGWPGECQVDEYCTVVSLTGGLATTECRDSNGQQAATGTPAPASCATIGTVHGTAGGVAEGTECVFPFKYKSVEYTGCTTAYHHSLWCVTEVDSSENYVSGKWGHCGTGCVGPTTCATTTGTANGANCVFPFTYKDEVYTGCTSQSHHSLWCYTNTARSKWGHCADDCTAPTTDTF